MVAIAKDDLSHPPVVGPDVTMADARAAAAADVAVDPARAAVDGRPSKWAVVVGDDGVLRGWVPIDTGVDGPVASRLTRFAVEVPVGSSLRTALAEMLQHDVSWVPVTEGGRYLGVLTPDGLHAAMRRSVGHRPADP